MREAAGKRSDSPAFPAAITSTTRKARSRRFLKELMPTKTIFVVLLLCSGLAADNLEKTQRKELESRVKTMTVEAEGLQHAGQLAEARTRYAESQALFEVKEVTEAIKHLDEEIHRRVKLALSDSQKLYEAKKFKEAVAVLDGGMKLQAFQSVLAYDLALCYYQLGDRANALEYLRKARAGTEEPRQKQQVAQFMTFITTGENGLSLNYGNPERIVRANQLVDSIGLEASLEDQGFEESLAPADATSSDVPSGPIAASSTVTASRPPVAHTDVHASHGSSLCQALAELKDTLASSPAATFNLANCAESNGRTAEAAKLLQRYLEISPTALDGKESRARIAKLNSLLTLPGQSGIEIRRLYASAYGDLAERKYDRALAAFNKASDLAPEFALTKWDLALLYEAMGDVKRASENFTRYLELSVDQSNKDEANLHLSTLEAKRSKYDEEVGEAEDIVADLFNRAMNLTFNQDANRSALRAKRARVKKKEDQKRAKASVGGFAVPFSYAQQQLGRATAHLQVALALFPLGAEANELMGLVFLQANDGRSAIRSFDVVASQGLPVAFYAEMRGHKQDQAVKCELSRDRVRLIFLASYDKKGNAVQPGKPAGDDGLGDIVVAPLEPRQQQFDSLDVALSDIKKAGTDRGLIKLKLASQEIYLSPIYLPSYTPVQGPQARRFANNYTRLFVRYPGLEDSKLGTEGMSGGEKFIMGYKIASAGADIAMSGFGGMNAISSVQDIISITRTIQAAMASVSVSFASWEKTVGDQQELLADKAFKSIPTKPMDLVFVHEAK
jgi:tetratricopeptide (TPR) repeat protein